MKEALQRAVESMKEREHEPKGSRQTSSYAPGALVLVFAAFFAVFYILLTKDPAAVTNVDLAAFYAASVQAFANGLSPYDVEALRQIRGDGVITPPFIYPPTSLILFYPLSFFSWSGAQLTVWISNLLVVGVLAWLLPLALCRLDIGKRFAMVATCLFAILLFGPIVVAMHHGQINLFLLLCLSAFWVLARSGRAVGAAIFLTLAILLKTYPIVLLPLLGCIGKKREIAYTSASLVVAFVVSCVILPTGLWTEWTTQIAPSGLYTHSPEGLHQPAAIWNQSLNGIFCRFFTESEWSTPFVINPGLARICTYTCAGLVILLGFWGVMRCRRYARSFDRIMLIALPSLYLIAPLSWEHHLVYLLPVLLMLFTSDNAWGSGTTVSLRMIVMGLWGVLALPQLLAVKGYTVVVLWALSLLIATRERALSSD